MANKRYQETQDAGESSRKLRANLREHPMSPLHPASSYARRVRFSRKAYLRSVGARSTASSGITPSPRSWTFFPDSRTS
jgi:hypothetical protein